MFDELFKGIESSIEYAGLCRYIQENLVKLSVPLAAIADVVVNYPNTCARLSAFQQHVGAAEFNRLQVAGEEFDYRLLEFLDALKDKNIQSAYDILRKHVPQEFQDDAVRSWVRKNAVVCYCDRCLDARYEKWKIQNTVNKAAKNYKPDYRLIIVDPAELQLAGSHDEEEAEEG